MKMLIDDLFQEAAQSWRNNRGVGTALVPTPFDSRILIYHILTKVYFKKANTFSIIIVEELQDRNDIIEFLTKQGNENDDEFRNLINTNCIKVFTRQFVSSGRWTSASDLCILYKVKQYDEKLNQFYVRCHYKLTIITKLLNSSDAGNLFKVTPILDCFKQQELDELRVSSPVEEMWISVIIPEDSESWKLYQYYTKYIETTINIFGSFDMIQQARIGNEKLNISATTICTQIAQENGWNEHLDMSYEFNRQIDEMYNPNNLRDRATKTYEIIRSRNTLIADYEGKLEKILEIVASNPDSKILIISKRGEFANRVTDYLNQNSEKDICGNYHNKVYDIPAVDINGNPVYYKSGKEKGKRKSMSYKAQMTLNENRFNLNMINCLSTSNAPDKSLRIDVDIVIITSPLCEDIKSYLYRLSNMRINAPVLKLFSIFCKNTIEQQKLLNKPLQETHKIVNKGEIIDNLENNFDFVIAD